MPEKSSSTYKFVGLRLLSAIACTELLIMLLSRWFSVDRLISPLEFDLADTLLLSVTSSLLIYFWVVKPLKVANKTIEAANEELETSRAELQSLNKEMAAKNLELEFANKEMESFIYSVSHDLRAPLRTMFSFAKILIEDYGNKMENQPKDYLMRITNASEKMTELINDLLRLSQISKQDMDRMDCDLSMLASSIVTGLREADPSRSVEVAITGGLHASVDPNLIRIALTNLIENAWKFTSKTTNARIIINAYEKEGKIVYFVRDNGAGFDQTCADKMFLPFQRLHPEKEFKGTGIGLAIVERIIRRHGGTVWAEGEVGKGATVYFTLGV